MKTVAFVAGRSGGHILPCLTLATRYKDQGYNIIFFSSHISLDKQIISQYSFIDYYYQLWLDNIPRKKLYLLPFFIFSFIKAFIISYKILKKDRPELIISSGGYIALPVCLAGYFLGIPIDLYELNSTAGAATKFLSFFARTIFICFKNRFAGLHQVQHKIKLADYPVRFQEMEKLNYQQARQQLGLNSNKKTIFILGGSQGSQFLNKIISDWVTTYPEASSTVQIIHQAGKQDLKYLEKIYASQNIKAIIFDYQADIYKSYCAADLIISRAGAGTLFEIKFFNKKALVIPLESSSTDHQLANASAFALENRQFTVIRQKELTISAVNNYINS